MAAQSPLPFPLPAAFTLGVCGTGTGGHGCSAPVAIAPSPTIRCSAHPGCWSGCSSSPLAADVFARYEARLGAGGEAGAADAPAAEGGRHWWAMNTTNCNLHDVPALHCAPGKSATAIEACKAMCAAAPQCGGFLYYNLTGAFAIKDTTCSAAIAPLPCTPSFKADCNDELFVLRSVPQPPAPQPGTLAAVEVCIMGGPPGREEVLGPDTDEGYTLAVPAGPGAALRATVTANTTFGVMRALESLTQLVSVRGGRTIPAAPVTVHDRPRFKYRGLMIDSGRHFLPIPFVKHVIDGLASLKMSLLHWHLSDSQSFPVASQRFPKLAAEGAYVSPPAPPPQRPARSHARPTTAQCIQRCADGP